jgi:hypothetical protein
MTAASERQSSAPDRWRLIGNRLQTALVTPIRVMRLRYLPLLMIYYAYGVLVTLAGAAGGWITFAGKNALYVAAQLLIAIGVVLQDVVADAMTTEVVDRTRPDGSPRPLAEVERELGLVQVLGRLALWSGILSVVGLSGWLAQIFRYETVFLLGLIVPTISVTGATLVCLDGASSRPIDWRILGGRTSVRCCGRRHRPWRHALRP